MNDYIYMGYNYTHLYPLIPEQKNTYSCPQRISSTPSRMINRCRAYPEIIPKVVPGEEGSLFVWLVIADRAHSKITTAPVADTSLKRIVITSRLTNLSIGQTNKNRVQSLAPCIKYLTIN